MQAGFTEEAFQRLLLAPIQRSILHACSGAGAAPPSMNTALPRSPTLQRKHPIRAPYTAQRPSSQPRSAPTRRRILAGCIQSHASSHARHAGHGSRAHLSPNSGADPTQLMLPDRPETRNSCVRQPEKHAVQTHGPPRCMDE